MLYRDLSYPIFEITIINLPQGLWENVCIINGLWSFGGGGGIEAGAKDQIQNSYIGKLKNI